jgi:inorganic pyrophosphatase
MICALPALLRHEAMAIDWGAWEALICANGRVIDRPRGSTHPRYPASIYPLDYGYIPRTRGGDGAEVDIWLGSAACGLAGAILTVDRRKGDREYKLLYNTTPEEMLLALRCHNEGAMSGYLVVRPR